MVKKSSKNSKTRKEVKKPKKMIIKLKPEKRRKMYALRKLHNMALHYDSEKAGIHLENIWMIKEEKMKK